VRRPLLDAGALQLAGERLRIETAGRTGGRESESVMLWFGSGGGGAVAYPAAIT